MDTYCCAWEALRLNSGIEYDNNINTSTSATCHTLLIPLIQMELSTSTATAVQMRVYLLRERYAVAPFRSYAIQNLTSNPL